MRGCRGAGCGGAHARLRTRCPAATHPGSPLTSTGAEDCLSLNVHVPREAETPLPVIVFLHGGGFTGGGGASYDPRQVSGRGVIVVMLNYRLGALGFLAHPALTGEWVGNFGIADQQLALAETMIGHWTAFARTGDPGGGRRPYLPGQARSFAVAGIGTVDIAAAHRCAFRSQLRAQ